MDCPRCGFNQPDDKYCANCGLDVESFLARPKPFWLRILQNPNLYAFLIGGILVTAAFYIFTNQRTVGRQMAHLLRGHFLLSREAAVPGDTKSLSDSKAKSLVSESQTSSPAQNTAPATTPMTTADKPTAPNYSQIEIGFFELSRDNLMALAGKILRDEGDWHVVYLDDAKSIESLQAAARKLPGAQEHTLQKEGGHTELDAGDVNPDLQAPYLAVGVDLIKNENLHWALDLQLPPPSAARTLAQASDTGENAAAPSGSLQLTTLEGNVHFTPQSALLLVYDPTDRNFGNLERQHPQLNKSPLRVLASEDFRLGYSALVVWVRLK